MTPGWLAHHASSLGFSIARTAGLSGFSLQGLGKGAGGNGIYLIQTSRAVVSDIGIAAFANGLHLNGAWNGGSDDGHGHGSGAIPCMYNDFHDLQIGQCGVGVNVNYSIANRFHDFVIGAVDTGMCARNANIALTALICGNLPCTFRHSQ